MSLYSEPVDPWCVEFSEASLWMGMIAQRAELEDEVCEAYERICEWNPPFTLQEAFDNANEALEEFGL